MDGFGIKAVHKARPTSSQVHRVRFQECGARFAIRSMLALGPGLFQPQGRAAAVILFEPKNFSVGRGRRNPARNAASETAKVSSRVQRSQGWQDHA